MIGIELGKFIAQIRQEKGITQEQLAEQLNIDKRKISRWENGNSTPELEMLIELCKIFNISLYELSIFQRIPDDTLREKAIKKFKTIKDLKRFNLRKKIFLIITILIGIFLGLTAIFTFDNYDTVAIYRIKGEDKNFKLQGTYTRAKDYNVFNINKIGYENADKSLLEMEVHDISFEIINVNTRIAFVSYNKEEFKSKQKLFQAIDKISTVTFSTDKVDYKGKENDLLTLRINYADNKNNCAFINIQFTLQYIFENSL